jgi:regulator of sirC expression with transglutaminase-like and TPR domain
VQPEEARTRLLQLLESAPDPFPLDRAALLLAVHRHPGLDIFPYEDRLDGYAARVVEALPEGEMDPRRRLGALRRVLFEEEGFHGNRDDYYDVRNSYLPDVLDRKLGIPISLATVMIGVTRRLDWPAGLVNFPTHVLVRYEAADESLAVDAFHGGLILSPEELVERWKAATGQPAPSLPEILEPASPRSAVTRMVNNIWMVHYQRREYLLAADTIGLLALLHPNNPLHDRDRGLLLLAGQETEQGLAHLEEYLRRVPDAADRAAIQARILDLKNPPLGIE